MTEKVELKMETKSLYVLVGDAGDGSFYPRYVIDPIVIQILQTGYDEGKLDYENGVGIDGDGFHYSEVKIPKDWTAAELGVSVMTVEDALRMMNIDKDDSMYDLLNATKA